ncbi:MAG: hypothetical protein HeimC3_44530 [Candidatus Heimdallarchaeota archaeon LC_3]|nr:MAG: hypothetical protein HeimC3_44530 [Candidatus Heimdallarchaeota archaeon LC_3]
MEVKKISIGKIIAVFFGIVFVFASIGMLFGGTAIIVVNEALSDSEGFISTPSYQIQDSSAVAIVVDSFELSNSDPDLDPNVRRWVNIDYNPGDFVKIKIKAKGMFIGIADSSDLLTYVGNVRYLNIVNIGFDSIEYTIENPGLTSNLTSTPPMTQSDFTWIVKSESGELLWSPEGDIIGQELAIVVMNLDGSPGIFTQVSAGAQIPFLGALGIGLLVFGIIFLFLAIILFVIAAKGKRKPRIERYRIYKDHVAPIVKSDHPDVRFCANCGSQLDRDSRFCSSCGEPTISDGIPSSKAQVSDIRSQDQAQLTGTPQLPQNSYVIADWWTRFWAWLIDIIIINMIIESFRWTLIAFTSNWGFITDSFFFSVGFSINGLAMLIYFTYAEGNYGTTLGKQALGLVVIKENGEKSTFGESAISAVGKAFLLPIDIIVGYFMQDPPVGQRIPLNQRLFQRISKNVTVFRPLPGSKPEGFLSAKIYG